MAKDRLRFGSISGSSGFESSVGSLADRIMEFGSDLNEQEQKKLLAKEREQERQDRLNRYAIEDQRYAEAKAEKASDKFDARQKELATNEALALIGGEKEFLAGKTSAENKAYADAIAGIEDPAERSRMQAEVAQYQQSGSQAKSWKDSVLGQTNMDWRAIGDLKRDIAKEAESARRFDIQLAETRAARAEAANERQEARNREEQAKKDLYGSKEIVDSAGSSLNKGKAGYFSTIENVPTGQKILDPTRQSEATKFEAEQYETDDSKAIIAKINELSGKILTPEQLKDDNLYSMFSKENPKSFKNTTEFGNLFSGITNARNKSIELDKANLKIKENNRILNSDRSTAEEKFEAKQNINALNSVLKDIENKYSPKTSDEGITFDEFKKAKIKESEEASKKYNEEMSSLQNKVAKVNKDVLDKYGIDETKSDVKYMTTEEVRNQAKEYALNQAKKNGLSSYVASYAAETAAKTAADEHEKLKKETQSSIAESSKESIENTIELQKKVFENATKRRVDIEKNLTSLKENHNLREEYGESRTKEMIADYESKLTDAINKENTELSTLKAMVAR